MEKEIQELINKLALESFFVKSSKGNYLAVNKRDGKWIAQGKEVTRKDDIEYLDKKYEESVKDLTKEYNAIMYGLEDGIWDSGNLSIPEQKILDVLLEKGICKRTPGIPGEHDTANGVAKWIYTLNSINEQKAYHGSNVDFDKFDLSKFRRGDYGYGIYFTKSKGYAGDYGNVKEYDIPDNEYLLSWEDTWQYQSEYVYNCLDKLFDDLYDNNRDAWEKIINIVDRGYGNDGEGLYMNLSEILKLSSKQTSELLYKYGIKGIDSFKGNCQVIFNPEDITLNIEKVNECLTNILENYHGVK